MEQSIYGYIIVSGCLSGIRKTNIVTSLVLVFFHVVLVLSFSMYLVSEIAGNQLTSITGDGKHKHTNSFYDWAHNDGAQLSQNRTWASWACAGEDWSYQSSILGKYKEYSDPVSGYLPLSKGRVFGIVAIILWTAVLLQECRAIINYSLYLCLPTSSVVRSGFMDRKAQSEVRCLPLWVKFMVGFLVVVRIMVIVILGLNGLKFLSHTDNLKDFILNSIALGFIFNLDEMIFSSFVNYRHQLVLADLEPIKVRVKPCVFCFIDQYSEMAGVLLLAIVVVLTYIILLGPFATQLRVQAFCAVCRDLPQSMDKCNH
eukprot:NODE_9728_length_1402_cov_15.537255.p1 GENE.NODE_9728_length_1402_cov_15.537255~~NODE_9728_length_1402_cov_15.537255.p1  ORF type:complete len:314 (-),score=55.25 NODE_9728_length_1402_cov_15.537255:291-1232(-)